MLRKPLPWLRLAIYAIGMAVCGGVVTREVYYALACTTTTGTIIAVGQNVRKDGRRSSSFWGEYEYFDADNVRHVGKAQSLTLLPSGNVDATTQPGEGVAVQYFPHAPERSRLVPTPLGCMCYGAVALLAVGVFVGELAVRSRRRRRRQQPA
jgi:hypothetical protein